MLEEKLMECINRSGVSLNAIAKAAGVDYAALHRFVNEGRNLQLQVVQRLCDHFGLELRYSDKMVAKVLKKVVKSLVQKRPAEFRTKAKDVRKTALLRHMTQSGGVDNDELSEAEKDVVVFFEVLSDAEKRRLLKPVINEVSTWEKFSRVANGISTRRLSELDRELQEFKEAYTMLNDKDKKDWKSWLKTASRLEKREHEFSCRHMVQLRITVSHCDTGPEGEVYDSGSATLKPSIMLEAVEAWEKDQEFTPRGTLGELF